MVARQWIFDIMKSRTNHQREVMVPGFPDASGHATLGSCGEDMDVSRMGCTIRMLQLLRPGRLSIGYLWLGAVWVAQVMLMEALDSTWLCGPVILHLCGTPWRYHYHHQNLSPSELSKGPG